MDKIEASYIDYRGFEFIKTLGRGTHGTVILVERKKDKQQYALKSIRKYASNGELLKQLGRIKREVLIMASLRHPNIIAVHDVCESLNRVTMTMEYASGGELFEYVDQSKDGLPENEIRRLFGQISSALNCMHLAGIVHRDLKLENILLDHNKNAKIADFGLSNRFKRGELMFTFCGSPLYASPEIVTTTPYFGPEVDCWSLGVILYIMTFARMPFSANNLPQLREVIRKARYTLPRPANYYLQHLIKSLLNANPHQRLNIKQVLSHPWLRYREDGQYNNFHQFQNKEAFEKKGFDKGDYINEQNNGVRAKFIKTLNKGSNNENNYCSPKKNEEVNTNLQKNQSYDFNDFAIGRKFREECHFKHNSYITNHKKSREFFNYRNRNSKFCHEKHLQADKIYPHRTKDKLYDDQQALKYKRQINIYRRAESKCDKLNNNTVIIEKCGKTSSDEKHYKKIENKNIFLRNNFSRNETNVKQTDCEISFEISSNKIEQTSRNNRPNEELLYHYSLPTNDSSNEVNSDRASSTTETQLFPQHLQHHNTSPLRKNLHLQQSMDSLENFYDIFNDIHLQKQTKLFSHQSIGEKNHELKKDDSVSDGYIDNDSIDSFDRVASIDLNYGKAFENDRRRSLSSQSKSLLNFTVPIIKEVKNPKTIIMADELTVICDVKTTSTDQINLFGGTYSTNRLKIEDILIKKALSTPCIQKTMLTKSCVDDIKKCMGPLTENINAFIKDGDYIVEYSNDEKSGKIKKDYYFDTNNNEQYYSVIDNLIEKNIGSDVQSKKSFNNNDNKIFPKLLDICQNNSFYVKNVLSSKKEKIQTTSSRKPNNLYCNQEKMINVGDSTVDKNEVYGVFFNTKYSDEDDLSIDSLDIQS